MKISSSSKQQRGLALMEALFVLILAAVASSVALQQYGRYLDNITNKQAAEHATIVADAAAKYLKDNYAAVVAIAGPTSPATITTAMLKTTNYLPSGFQTKRLWSRLYGTRDRATAEPATSIGRQHRWPNDTRIGWPASGSVHGRTRRFHF